MTDLPFSTPAPDPTRPERQPRKCRRHQWRETPAGTITGPGGSRRVWHGPDCDWNRCEGCGPQRPHEVCARCGAVKDAARSRRNRNNGKRGRSDELTVATIVGGRKIGPLGLPWDVEIEGYARLQSKQLDRWPSLAKVIEWLDAIPAGPELRGVTLADTPGAGHRTRRLVVFELDEWSRWHGRAKP